MHATPPAIHALPPATVIQRYQAALEAQAVPPHQVFEYTVDQVGFHDLAQTHRIYRSPGVQRDELIADNGHPVKPPVVRIRRGVRDRYALENVAPQPGAYTFSYVGVAHVGAHLAYAFDTVPSGTAKAFTVRRVVIDGLSYLPTSLSFETHSARANGTGTMSFAKAGRYWVPTRVAVTATVDGKKASESISFSAYAFPQALPPATFRVAHSSASTSSESP